jgi:hypothetical protein
MNPEIQRAQDMLDAMQGQRDNALNAMVLMQADVIALRREIAALKASVEPSDLKKQAKAAGQHDGDAV